MKIEIDIPQLTELNTNVRQLIDTLNDVAVMQVNALRKPVAVDDPKAALEVAPSVIAPTSEEAPKRTRKKREAAPEPEIIELKAPTLPADVSADDLAAKQMAEYARVAEQLQLAPVAAEEPAPVPAQEETPALPTLFDMDYFRANVIPAIASANKLPEAKAWIAEHGADALKDLDPKHYAAFHKFACELCGVENL